MKAGTLTYSTMHDINHSWSTSIAAFWSRKLSQTSAALGSNSVTERPLSFPNRARGPHLRARRQRAAVTGHWVPPGPVQSASPATAPPRAPGYPGQVRCGVRGQSQSINRGRQPIGTRQLRIRHRRSQGAK